MRCARKRLQGDRHVVVGGLGGQPECVVEEDFVGSGLDEQRRQFAQVGEEGAGEGRAGVGAREVVVGAGGQRLPGQGRVDGGLGLVAAAGLGEVRPGGEDSGRHAAVAK